MSTEGHKESNRKTRRKSDVVRGETDKVISWRTDDVTCPYREKDDTLDWISYRELIYVRSGTFVLMKSGFLVYSVRCLWTPKDKR